MRQKGGDTALMAKVSAWTYLESLLARRRTLELRTIANGGFSATVNGFYYGIGKSPRAAVLDAVRTFKDMRRRDRQ